MSYDYRKTKTKEPEINELRVRLGFFPAKSKISPKFFNQIVTLMCLLFSSMSVWHTGSNNYPRSRNDFYQNMAPSGHDAFAAAPVIVNPNLRDLIAEYQKTCAENTALFVQSLLKVVNGGIGAAELKLLTMGSSAAQEPPAAANYREHRMAKASSNDEWGEESSKQTSNDEWGESSKPMSNNDRRPPPRGSFNNNRDGGNGRNFNNGERKERQPRPGDWNCPKCERLNYSGKTECYWRSCATPKPSNDSSTSDGGLKRPAADDDDGWGNDAAAEKKVKVEAAPAKPAADDDDGW